MKTLVANFSKQLTEAISIGSKAKLTASASKINNVLICGLGGSGIGGSIVAQVVTPTATVPIDSSKGYFIPGYVNENTLVIISSYSGNTEETLQCMEQAIQKNSKIVCITSGGSVEKIAKEKGFDYIIVPGGMPPRSCLGYSLVQLFYILGFFKIISEGFVNDLQAAVKLIDQEESAIISEATAISKKLMGKLPIIYATTYNEGIAIRFRQQLNENSKILCWHQIIPEMNHNELVGWTEKNDNLVVIFFLDKDEYSRNKARVEINKEVIKKYTANVIDIYSKGNSAIEKAIYFIHLGDWVSVILGESRGVDLMEIKVIDHLKSALSKI
ncbi:MAG TPA: bifunctional phosphoglucose/phosphomannose isomerase [Bacteroidia bacterium]|jgi:glucose/mannose-6-phosphate isomerase|nr:bifunctional phosphoglucose/phosphomannose isomerase [Bacteroidia bacterium]